MVDGRNFRQAIHAFRTGELLREGGGGGGIASARKLLPQKTSDNSDSMGGDNDYTLPPIQISQPASSYGGLGAAKTAIQSTPKPSGMVGMRTAAQTAPLQAKATADTADDDAEGMKAAAAENPDKFSFGSAKGSSKVSATELQKWRDSSGNASGTLGQYMNARDGKTAVKGGSNDFDSTDPNAMNKTSNAPTPPPRPGSLNLPTNNVPSPPPRPASVAKATSTNTSKNDDDDDDLDESVDNNLKKESNMSNPLIESFLALQNRKNSNLFEAAKSITTPKAKDKPLDTLVNKVNTPKQKIDEALSKLSAAEYMELEEKVLNELSNKTLNSYKDKAITNKKELGNKIYNMSDTDMDNEEEHTDFIKYQKRKNGLNLADNKIKKKLTKEEFETLVKAIEEGAVATQMHVHDTKSKNFSVDHIKGSTKDKEPMPKLKLTGVEKDLKDGHVSGTSKKAPEPIPRLKTLDPMTRSLAGKKMHEELESALGKLTAQEYEALEEAFKDPANLPGGKAKFPGADTTSARPKIGLEKVNKNANVPKKVHEEDESIFSEEELAHIAATLEEEDAPVKRGRGRPPGSKSASSIHGDSQDSEGNSYGPKNLQAQIRPGNAPFFKNGTEHKKLVNPDNGKEHDIPLHHITKFSNDLADAEKPAQKLEIEAAFKKKHMSH